MSNILKRRSGIIALVIGAVAFVPIYLECLRASQAGCSLQSLPADCVPVLLIVTAALLDLLLITAGIFFGLVMIEKIIQQGREFMTVLQRSIPQLRRRK